MKSRTKKWLPGFAVTLLPAAGIFAGLFTGCAGTGNGGIAEGIETSNGDSGTGMDTLPAAKGRYIEQEISLPEEIDQMKLIDCLPREDSSLEFYFRNESGIIFSYIYADNKWEKQELPFSIEDVQSIKTISNVVKGGDGSYYIGGMGENSSYHLYMADEKKTAAEVYKEVFHVPEERRFGLIPNFFAILSDGSLLLSAESDAAVYNKEEKKQNSFAQDAIDTDVRNSVYVSDSSYITILDDHIVCYDIRTGDKSGSYPIPGQVNMNNGNMALYENEDKSIYAAGETGLYRIAKDGTIWEQIIDGTLNSMGRPDIYLKHFYPGVEQDYYGIYQKSETGEAVLFHYVYDENVDTVPPVSLTIYALRDSATVKQAAFMLQKEKPDVRIDLRIALENAEEKVTADVLQALNTELLNGKGADVLILDGLPAEAYREKGILLDLSSVAGELEPALIKNLTQGFTSENGIYYLPARVKLPVIYGDPNAVNALSSLEAMGSYANAVPLLAPNTYENTIRLTARTCYSELFDENGALKEGVLGKWLAAIKSAGEQSGFKSEYTMEELDRMNVSSYLQKDGFNGQSAFSLAEQKCSAAAELLTCLDSSLLTIAVADMEEYEIEDIGGTYIPTAIVGINASTQQRETAEEFVRMLFSPIIQNEMLWDGFAVRNDSLKQWAEEEKETSLRAAAQGSDVILMGEWPKRKRRDEILSLVQAASIPVVIDETILDMIVSGSKGCWDETESMEEAVFAIENQIQLYMAEKQ